MSCEAVGLWKKSANKNLGLIRFRACSVLPAVSSFFLSFWWLQGCLVAELEPKMEPSPIG